MKSMRNPIAATLIALSAYPGGRLQAQCPDGSPPPCRTTTAVRVTIDPNAVAILPSLVTRASRR
jgi:hypothetical protein